MIRKSVPFTLIILSIFLALGCFSYRKGNDRAVETLRQQLIHEKFNEVYEGASDITRAQITREQFVEWMENATATLKGVDSEINWRRDERGSPEEDVYREDNWSSLNLEKNGRRLNVQVDWAERFALCGITISGDIPEGGIRFRNCD